jgi:L-ascorbate metabolism protein UlaG (beta-lactamase superfamily)
MRLTLARNAKLMLELRGRRILVPNPTVGLPLPPEAVVSELDGVIATHRHRDHLDGVAEEMLPRDVPVFCPGRPRGRGSRPDGRRRHLEALDHCFLGRVELQASIPDVLAPGDGETVDI